MHRLVNIYESINGIRVITLILVGVAYIARSIAVDFALKVQRRSPRWCH